MRRLRSILVALLFLSAVYLYAWPSPTLFYAGVVLLHVAAGIWLAIAILFLPAVRKIFGNARLAKQAAGWGWLMGGSGLGLLLIFTGARRPLLPLLYVHIAACLIGVALLVAAWVGTRGWLADRVSTTVLRYGLVLLAAAGLAAGAWWVRTVPWQHAYRIQNPSLAPASMDGEGDGANGPFFPSSAQTADRGRIPANFFMESEACQRCHADIYAEWSGSAHHLSSFNNQWYRKSIEYMQDVAGVRPSKWCGGCHDPALLFSGMMDTPIRQIVNTPEAHAGLGCMMCHSVAAVKSTMGQGDFTLEYPALHRLATSKNPFVRRLHDFLVELNPEPHRRVFLKPFMRNQTAEFCSACHKVHLDVPVNHYRWIRGFNEYDNWQASGVSGQGARSFYYPPQPQNCADCHMPLVKSKDAGNVGGLVHSHRFPAANTALPFVEQDAEQLAEVKKFLEDQAVSVDIFAVSPEQEAAGTAAPVGGENGIPPRNELATTFAVGEEAEQASPAGPAPPAQPVTAPLSRAHAAVRRGDTVRVDVVVRTRKLGHFFPGGTVDAFDCWLEFGATDENGRTLFWSGAVADDGAGPVDPGAHFYRSLLLDAHGNPINKRNAWASRAVVYVHLIPPGAADTVRYRLRVPPEAGNHIHLTARLNYRKFSWWNTQFAFAGVRDPAQPHPAVTPDFDDGRFVFSGNTSSVSGKLKAIPRLPIVTLAQDAATLDVLPANAAAPEPRAVLDPSDWQRWNDYGIGLLLQGDLKGAEAAFVKITEMDPKNPDGWVNAGRARLQEGNLPAARQALERALALAPSLARAQFFYAKVLRDEGRYDEAATHLREVLAQYPRDRVAHNELGRILFLERRYTEAAQEFQATLAIDPEDLEANYNLMLCATGLGQAGRAAEFQRRYLRFKADESAQALIGPYLRAHPEDNLERQPIHEHTSGALAAGAGSRGAR
ncbi:MAG TPA: tetratricopeptide repeat protein [Candidatus Acidoferrales bacterium]|jgi:cytochrome c-type biogenesis protein CcmH/NrfG|nr:tetratricopeptide repeat protein [Candidatus Acidoferrales bacterium]